MTDGPFRSVSGTSALAAMQLAQRLATTSINTEGHIDVDDQDLADFADGSPDGMGGSSSSTTLKHLYVDPTPDRFDRLVDQIKTRLVEGQGETILEVGIEGKCGVWIDGDLCGPVCGLSYNYNIITTNI